VSLDETCDSATHLQAPEGRATGDEECACGTEDVERDTIVEALTMVRGWSWGGGIVQLGSAMQAIWGGHSHAEAVLVPTAMALAFVLPWAAMGLLCGMAHSARPSRRLWWVSRATVVCMAAIVASLSTMCGALVLCNVWTLGR
jgi:hypothetical protein